LTCDLSSLSISFEFMYLSLNIDWSTGSMIWLFIGWWCLSRHEYYQKPEEVVVTIFAKGIPAENVVVDFGEQIVCFLADAIWFSPLPGYWKLTNSKYINIAAECYHWCSWPRCLPLPTSIVWKGNWCYIKSSLLCLQTVTLESRVHLINIALCFGNTNSNTWIDYFDCRFPSNLTFFLLWVKQIIPDKCKVVVLSTKIEIRLAKAEAIHWTSLEYSKDVLPQKIIVPSGELITWVVFSLWYQTINLWSTDTPRTRHGHIWLHWIM